MFTSTEWLALATTGIGVVGTLAGVTITQAFANKREQRQRIQDRDTQIQLWEREDSLRFHNDKKVAYSTFIAKMHLWLTQMQSQLHGEYGGQAYPSDGFGEFESEITSLRAQLELIAPPEVWTATEVLWASGAAVTLTLAVPDMYSKERRDQNTSEFAKHLTRCIGVMRHDLAKGVRTLTASKPAPSNPVPKRQA
jgi:hypothetical protein